MAGDAADRWPLCRPERTRCDSTTALRFGDRAAALRTRVAAIPQSPAARPAAGGASNTRVEAYRLSGGGYGPPTLAGAGETLRPTHFEGLEVEVDDVLRPLR